MARTFLSGLVLVVKQVCTYMNKYGAFILPLLTDDEKAIFTGLQAACRLFLNSSIVVKAKND